MKLRFKLGLIFGSIAGVISLIINYLSYLKYKAAFGGSIKDKLGMGGLEEMTQIINPIWVWLIPAIITLVAFFAVGLILGGVIGLIIEKIKAKKQQK